MAIIAISIMEGAKEGCLTVFVADAGWQSTVMGLCADTGIPRQVLPGVLEDTLRRMRPDLCFLSRV